MCEAWIQSGSVPFDKAVWRTFVMLALRIVCIRHECVCIVVSKNIVSVLVHPLYFIVHIHIHYLWYMFVRECDVWVACH